MSRTPLSIAMVSHPGRVRRGNEDACAGDLEQGIVVVCDGVGGAAGGEVASRMAADSVVRSLQLPQDSGRLMPAQSRLLSAIRTANREVCELAQQKPQFHGMATTLVALYTKPDATLPHGRETVWLANVGDSRCYRLRGQNRDLAHRRESGRESEVVLEQLTWDHSVVEEQVRAGQLTRAQAELSPIRHVITRAIGSSSTVEADLYELDRRPGDLYLLTTDGLMRELSDEEIATILMQLPSRVEEAALYAVCERLVQTAVDYGGNDNITCALVYMH